MAQKRPKTIIDLQKLLGKCIAAFLERKIDETRLRAIAAACNVLSGIIRDGDLEIRISKLEERQVKNESDT